MFGRNRKVYLDFINESENEKENEIKESVPQQLWADEEP